MLTHIHGNDTSDKITVFEDPEVVIESDSGAKMDQ
jgi:hypothetical protein